MTLNEDNSNKESIAGAMTIQIALPLAPYLPTIAYRILVKLLSVWSISHQRYDLILNSLTYSLTIAILSIITLNDKKERNIILLFRIELRDKIR